MNIWVPKFKIIEPDREIPVASGGLAGEFQLTASAPGRAPRKSPWFSNLILNNGLDSAGSTPALLQRCAVGTGTTAPNIAQNSLVSQIAVTSDVQSNVVETEPTTPYRITKTVRYRFAQGAAAGNLTEVAVGTNTGTPMSAWSRELIRDQFGNPISFPVLADEFLDVTYRITGYPPLSDLEGTINISGTPYDFVMRAAQVGTVSGNTAGWSFAWATGALFFAGAGQTNAFEFVARASNIGGITEAPIGTSFNASSYTNGSYSNGNYYRDSVPLWGLNAGNVPGGIRSVQWTTGRASATNGSRMNFQIQYNPPIPKNDTQILTLPMRHTWGRT